MMELQINMISRQASLIGVDGWMPLTSSITKPNTKPKPPQIKPLLIKHTPEHPPPQIKGHGQANIFTYSEFNEPRQYNKAQYHRNGD